MKKKLCILVAFVVIISLFSAITTISSFAHVDGNRPQYEWNVPKINPENPAINFDGIVDLEGEWYGALCVSIDFSEDSTTYEEITLWPQGVWSGDFNFNSYEECDPMWRMTINTYFLWDDNGLYIATKCDDCQVHNGKYYDAQAYCDYQMRRTDSYDGGMSNHLELMITPFDSADAYMNNPGGHWPNFFIGTANSGEACWIDKEVATDPYDPNPNEITKAIKHAQVNTGVKNADGFYEFSQEIFLPWDYINYDISYENSEDGEIVKYGDVGTAGTTFTAGLIYSVRSADETQTRMKFSNAQGWRNYDFYTLSEETAAKVPSVETEIVPAIIDVLEVDSPIVIDGSVDSTVLDSSYIFVDAIARADYDTFIHPNDGTYLTLMEQYGALDADSYYYFAQDDENLYVTVVVNKEYTSNSTASNLWAQGTDCIQFYLAVDNGDEDMYNDPHIGFGINANSDCSETYVNCFEQSMPNASGTTECSSAINAVIKSVDGKTVYEMAIPKAECLGNSEDVYFSAALIFDGTIYYQVGTGVLWANRCTVNCPLLLLSAGTGSGSVEPPSSEGPEYVDGNKPQYDYIINKINPWNPSIEFDGVVDLENEWKGATCVSIDMSEDSTTFDEITIWPQGVWSGDFKVGSYEELDPMWRMTINTYFLWDDNGLYIATKCDDCSIFKGVYNAQEYIDYLAGRTDSYNGDLGFHFEPMIVASADKDAYVMDEGGHWPNFFIGTTNPGEACWTDNDVATDSVTASSDELSSKIKHAQILNAGYSFSQEIFLPWDYINSDNIDGQIIKVGNLGTAGTTFRAGLIYSLRSNDEVQTRLKYSNAKSWTNYDSYTLSSESVALSENAKLPDASEFIDESSKEVVHSVVESGSTEQPNVEETFLTEEEKTSVEEAKASGSEVQVVIAVTAEEINLESEDEEIKAEIAAKEESIKTELSETLGENISSAAIIDVNISKTVTTTTADGESSVSSTDVETTAKPVTVTVKVPSGVNPKSIIAVVNTDNNNAICPFTVINIDGIAYISFETDHFSAFALVQNNHSFDETAWGYQNKNGHAHLCVIEGHVDYSDLIPHTNSNGDDKCDECGYFLGCNHYIIKFEAIKATCQSAGNIEYWKCSKCGDMFDNLNNKIDSVVDPIRNHEWDTSEWGYQQADGHANYCKNCIAHNDVIAHTPNIAEPTEEQDQICTECGYVIATKKHVHESEKIPGVAATCTKEGYTDGEKCSICDEILVEQRIIPKVAHEAGLTVVEKATFLSYDFVSYCKNCGAELSRKTIIREYFEPTIPEVTPDVTPDVDPEAPHVHTDEDVKGFEATCTENGLTDGVICGECGETIVAQKIVSANGHTYSPFVVENLIEATATENGYYEIVSYCSVCGEEIARLNAVVPATGVVENPDTADEKAPVNTIALSAGIVAVISLAAVATKKFLKVK